MTLPSKEYIKNANRYMENHWQFNNHLNEERHQNRIKYVAGFCTGKTLEVGSANGFSTNLIKETYNLDITGLEPTDWGHKQSCENYPHITVVKSFVEEMPFLDNTFETVLAPEIMEHVETPILALNELFRVASKRVIITSPVNEAGVKNDPDHKRYFTYQGVLDMAKKYSKFNSLKCYGLNRAGVVIEPETVIIDNNFNPKIFFGIFVIELKKES